MAKPKKLTAVSPSDAKIGGRSGVKSGSTGVKAPPMGVRKPPSGGGSPTTLKTPSGPTSTRPRTSTLDMGSPRPIAPAGLRPASPIPAKSSAAPGPRPSSPGRRPAKTSAAPGPRPPARPRPLAAPVGMKSTASVAVKTPIANKKGPNPYASGRMGGPKGHGKAYNQSTSSTRSDEVGRPRRSRRR